MGKISNPTFATEPVALYVNAAIGGYAVQLKALLDTGASISVFNPNLWNMNSHQLAHLESQLKPTRTKAITVASGQSLRTRGCVTVHVKIETLKTILVTGVWVDECKHACVIGNTQLNHNKWGTQHSERGRELWFGERSKGPVALISSPEGMELCGAISTPQTKTKREQSNRVRVVHKGAQPAVPPTPTQSICPVLGCTASIASGTKKKWNELGWCSEHYEQFVLGTAQGRAMRGEVCTKEALSIKAGDDDYIGVTMLGAVWSEGEVFKYIPVYHPPPNVQLRSGWWQPKEGMEQYVRVRNEGQQPMRIAKGVVLGFWERVPHTPTSGDTSGETTEMEEDSLQLGALEGSSDQPPSTPPRPKQEGAPSYGRSPPTLKTPSPTGHRLSSPVCPPPPAQRSGDLLRRTREQPDEDGYTYPGRYKKKSSENLKRKARTLIEAAGELEVELKAGVPPSTNPFEALALIEEEEDSSPYIPLPPTLYPKRAQAARVHVAREQEREKSKEEAVSGYYLRRAQERRENSEPLTYRQQKRIRWSPTPPDCHTCECEGEQECEVCEAKEEVQKPKERQERKGLSFIEDIELEREVCRMMVGSVEPHSVRLARAKTLPPHSEVVVSVALEGVSLPDAGTYLLEATNLPQLRPRTWKLARGVVSWHGRGYVVALLANLGDRAVHVKKGEHIGTWEPVKMEEEVNAIKSETDAGFTYLEDHEITPLASEPVGLEAIRKNLEERCEHLNMKQKNELAAVLENSQYAFRDHAGRTSMVKHTIDVGESRPIRGGRYRMSHTEEGKVREIVQDMLKKSVVRPSKSPWGASVVLVPKKDGSTRFCVDYRRLNAITTKDVYPLPRIDSTLDRLSGAQYFSTLDLTSGFWQVEMSEESAAKTAFSTPHGLYEFTVMPFGLTNAPATFQRLMDSVLGHLGVEYVLVYLDDVLIFSRTFEEHLAHIDTVLQCIRDANLCVKLKKCHFAQTRTAYLGHVISGEGIEPDPGKLTAVQELEHPKNVREVRGFLGFVGFYRRFIQDFSTKAKPLTELTKKANLWHWTPECTIAFNQLRDALLQQPVLKAPDFAQQFTVRCDASYLGLGAVLTQGEGIERRVVAYASRTLKDAETRYTATEIECLAMKWAVTHFRPYIHGTRFTLETDHVALTWLRTVQHSNARLIRTALALQHLDMHIVHKAGVTMHDADALSRLRRKTNLPLRNPTKGVNLEGWTTSPKINPKAKAQLNSCTQQDTEEEVEESKQWSDYEYSSTNECESETEFEEEEGSEEHVPVETGTVAAGVNSLGAAQHQDSSNLGAEVQEQMRHDIRVHSVYGAVLRMCEGVKIESPIPANVVAMAKQMVAREGLLYYVEQMNRGGRAAAGSTRFRLFIPKQQRAGVMFACHDHLLSGGHQGVKRTYEKVRARYYWPNMFKDIEEWCQGCRECMMRKSPGGLRLSMSQIPIPSEPWEYISVDVMGPFVTAEESGNKFVVVFCDLLTRYVETIPLRVQDALSLARGLVERIVCRHGCPRLILSDRGLPFLSKLAHEVYRLLRVRKMDTAGYRPQTNGLVERFNRTFGDMLSVYVNSKHTDWDKFLPFLTFCYNTGTHAGLKETPYYLMHGRMARLPIDINLQPPDTQCEKDLMEYTRELLEGLRVARAYGTDNMQRAQQQRAANAPPSRRIPVYQPGQQVLVRMEPLGTDMSKKLLLKWQGPYRVVRMLGQEGRSYEVTDNKGLGRPVNVLRMKVYSKTPHPTSEEADYADHLRSAGERIESECNRGRKRQGSQEEKGSEKINEHAEEEGVLEEQEQEDEEAGGTQPKHTHNPHVPYPQEAASDNEALMADSGDGDGSQAGPVQPTPLDPKRRGRPRKERSAGTDNSLKEGGQREDATNEAVQSTAERKEKSATQERTWADRASPAKEKARQEKTRPTVDRPTTQTLDTSVKDLRLRGADVDGGAMQLCKRCHNGRKGHKCKRVYAPARQAVVNERRRGKDPENHVPLFGIAHRRRNEEQHTIRGVFAPFDLREMEGAFESFTSFVKRTTGKKAKDKDWNYACEVCSKTGGLTMCMGCNLVYHERCLVTKVIDEGLKRNEELVCPTCIRELKECSVRRD